MITINTMEAANIPRAKYHIVFLCETFCSMSSVMRSEEV